jgi:diacylglycerol kinase
MAVSQSTAHLTLHAGHSLPRATGLVFAGIASAGLLGLALAAYLRRRSGSYLLILLALGALLARSLVGLGTVLGRISQPQHHLLEHALDVGMAALVIAAVYYARTVTPDTPEPR